MCESGAVLLGKMRLYLHECLAGHSRSFGPSHDCWTLKESGPSPPHVTSTSPATDASTSPATDACTPPRPPWQSPHGKRAPGADGLGPGHSGEAGSPDPKCPLRPLCPPASLGVTVL